MPKKHSPTVSVIMPVYNTSLYLREALDSVFNQTFSDFELICVDDNSKDGSYKILMEYKKKHSTKMRVYRNVINRGVGYSSNLAISKAKGVLIARMDSDDIMYSTRLERQAKFLFTHPEVVMVGGQVVVIDVEGKRIGYKRFPLDHEHAYDMLFNLMPIQQGASMINRALLPKKFKFYLGNSRVAEEVELYFKLIEYGDFANIKSSVLKYRHYFTSTSLKDVKKTFYKTFKMRMKSIKKYGYKPSLGAFLLNFIQLFIVTVLPARWIYPLFIFARGIRSKRGWLHFKKFKVFLYTKVEYPFRIK